MTNLETTRGVIVYDAIPDPTDTPTRFTCPVCRRRRMRTSGQVADSPRVYLRTSPQGGRWLQFASIGVVIAPGQPVCREHTPENVI